MMIAAPYTICDVARDGRYETGRLQVRSLLERERGSRSLVVVRAVKKHESGREDAVSVAADAVELFTKEARPAISVRVRHVLVQFTTAFLIVSSHLS